MSAPVLDWKQQARELRESGLSEREIAEQVGKAPSSVHEALKDDSPDPIPGQQDIDGGEVPDGRSPVVEEFEEEAGPAVGPMPPQPPIESIYVEEIRVDGTTQTALDVGGKRASSCKVSIGGQLVVDGFFRKGDRIRGSFEAVITSAGSKDKLDKQTGIVTEAAQSHAARLTDVVLD